MLSFKNELFEKYKMFEEKIERSFSEKIGQAIKSIEQSQLNCPEKLSPTVIEAAVLEIIEHVKRSLPNLSVKTPTTIDGSTQHTMEADHSTEYDKDGTLQAEDASVRHTLEPEDNENVILQGEDITIQHTMEVEDRMQDNQLNRLLFDLKENNNVYSDEVC